MMNRITGTRCLVTGGAGFIGSTIADQLLEAGAAEVVILDNFVRGSWNNVATAQERGGVKVIKGDICDAALVD
jgi:UDP-glucose 4-epimerase